MNTHKILFTQKENNCLNIPFVQRYETSKYAGHICSNAILDLDELKN